MAPAAMARGAAMAVILTQRPNEIVALDAATGADLWDVEVADKDVAHAFTLVPLAIGDKVLVGSTGGDQGIRGFIAALDAETGAEAWRFYTIPGPGEPGHETWEPCPPNPETYCDPEARNLSIQVFRAHPTVFRGHRSCRPPGMPWLRKRTRPHRCSRSLEQQTERSLRRDQSRVQRLRSRRPESHTDDADR